MILNFGISREDITEDSLSAAFKKAYSEYDDDKAFTQAIKLLPIYRDILSTLSRDWKCSMDIKRILVKDIIHESMIDKFNSDAFIPECGKTDPIAFYVKKHFNDLKSDTQKYVDKNTQTDPECLFLLPVKLHYNIAMMIQEN
ncbi:MAG: hypothetical protein PHT07_10770 [Paludibacter sp.]|nr:hypothetical protein [Paludibacter sp.]